MGGERHRVRAGDRFQVIGKASTVFEMEARVTVEFDDGRLRDYRRALTTVADRVARANNFGADIEADGRVVRAIIANKTAGVSRGRVRGVITTLDSNLRTIDVLLDDYVEAGGRLGRFTDTGPGGGNGFKENRVIADDVAPADIEETLAATNALRRIDGFIWYYHCSGDVADRTLRAFFRSVGDGLPTGMTEGSNTIVGRWPTASVLTLSANQEGLIYVNASEGKSYSINVDNGAFVKESTSTQADAFPYWAQENDVGEIFFDVTDEEAADRHSIYIIQEEWLAQ